MTDREEVLRKARELGKSLKESEEYRELVDAQKALDEDQETQQMLQEYEAKRNEVQIKQMMGQNADEELRELTDLEGKIMQKETMQRYTKAEENFRNLVDEANQEIVKAMEEGEEEE